MSGFAKQTILFPVTARKLLIIPAAISLIKLCQYYVQVGLDPILSLLLDKYEKVLNFLLGWAVPVIEYIGRWIGWNITLYPHWRHILVLLSLYFFAGAHVEKKEHKLGRQNSWIFRLFLGLIVASCTSLLLGTMPLTSADVWPNFLIALVAFCAAAFNDLSLRAYRGWRTISYETTIRLRGYQQTRWQYFKTAAIPITIRTVISLALAFPLISYVQHIMVPGVVILILFVLYLSLNQIYLGVRELPRLRIDGESWRSAASRSRGVLIGVNMLWVFVIAIAGLIVSIAKELASK